MWLTARAIIVIYSTIWLSNARPGSTRLPRPRRSHSSRDARAARQGRADRERARGALSDVARRGVQAHPDARASRPGEAHRARPDSLRAASTRGRWRGPTTGCAATRRSGTPASSGSSSCSAIPTTNPSTPNEDRHANTDHIHRPHREAGHPRRSALASLARAHRRLAVQRLVRRVTHEALRARRRGQRKDHIRGLRARDHDDLDRDDGSGALLLLPLASVRHGARRRLLRPSRRRWCRSRSRMRLAARSSRSSSRASTPSRRRAGRRRSA